MFPVIVTPGLSRAEILLSYSKLYNAQTKAQSYFTGLEAILSKLSFPVLFEVSGKPRIRPSKRKKQMFLVRFSIKKRAGGQFFFVFYYFLLHAFFTHYYLPPGIRWTLRTMSLVF